MMCTTVNSWLSSKCSGTGDITCIKPCIQSRSTPITPISCTGRTLEITIEGWRTGTRNLWNTTSNWHISQERRMDGPTRYQGAQIMIRAIRQQRIGGVTTQVFHQGICSHNDGQEGGEDPLVKRQKETTEGTHILSKSRWK